MGIFCKENRAFSILALIFGLCLFAYGFYSGAKWAFKEVDLVEAKHLMVEANAVKVEAEALKAEAVAEKLSAEKTLSVVNEQRSVINREKQCINSQLNLLDSAWQKGKIVSVGGHETEYGVASVNIKLENGSVIQGYTDNKSLEDWCKSLPVDPIDSEENHCGDTMSPNKVVGQLCWYKSPLLSSPDSRPKSVVILDPRGKMAELPEEKGKP